MKSPFGTLLCAVVFVASLVPAVAVLAGNAFFDVDRTFYPSYPSLVKWNKSNAPFTDPETCGGCHPRQYEEWSGSVHAMAFQDPVYQGELNKGFKAVGHAVTKMCEGCHSPIGMVTGEIKGPGLAGLGRTALAGVSCDVCHSVSSVTHWQTPHREPGNGSLVLSPGQDRGDGYALVKYGPDKPAEGCGGGFHECAESPIHLRVDLCASCHQLFHHESFFPIESTYTEWRRSTYAQKGILCQDCHMVDIDVFIKTADTLTKPERSQYRHYFSGANYLLSSLAEAAARRAGDKEGAARLRKKYDMAVARLKAAADLELFPVYRDGALAEVKVRVKNLRAGHDLPTSLTNVRQMWVEVKATDAAGKVILKSGGVDGPGALTDGTRVFDSSAVDVKFHFTLDPWETTGFSRHETIPARGYRDVDFGVRPVQQQGRVKIEAKLRYRQADQKVLKKLLESLPSDMDLETLYGLKTVPAPPIVDMVVKKASFNSRP